MPDEQLERTQFFISAAERLRLKRVALKRMEQTGARRVTASDLIREALDGYVFPEEMHEESTNV